MNYELCGIYSSILTTSIAFPIDTLKSRFQSNFYNQGSFINNKQGSKFSLKGLYKGIAYEYASVAPSSFVYWSIYKKCRERQYSDTYSAGLSSIFSNLVDTPFDLYKKNKQLSLNEMTTSKLPISLVSKYFGTNLLCGSIYSIVYMNTLRKLKDETGQGVAMLTSCSLATMISYPLDKYKTYLLSGVKTNFFKGFWLRLLYCNMYSGLYMTLFFYFSGNSLP